MKRYVAFLRGINVSGQKMIKMDHLIYLFESMYCSSVYTYLQSGNVIFSHKAEAQKDIEVRIEGAIKALFDFDVPVLVLSEDELRTIIDSNPFLSDPTKDPAYFHVTFLDKAPLVFSETEFAAKLQEGEAVRVTTSAVYLYCPNGYGSTKLTNNFLEKKLGVRATTRNWKTTTNLQIMLSGIIL